MSETLHLLIVDDEMSILKPLADRLRTIYHYDVDTAGDGQEALQLIDKFHGSYDVALIDQVLDGDISGLELLQEIKAKYAEIQVIICTGWGMEQVKGIEILNQGAYRYIAKPFNLEELALTIRFAAEQRQIRREHEYLSTLVQVSKELAHTIDLEKQLALVWDYVREQLATSTFFIALYDSTTDTLQFHQSYDEGEPDPLDDRHLGDNPSQWGVAGHVVKLGQEQAWLTQEESEKRWQDLGIKPLISGKGPSKAGICLPLQVGGKILGVLSVQSYQPKVFDQAFLNTVRTLGGQLASAIENARLISTLEKTSSHLEGLVEGSLDAAVFIDIDKHITVFNRQAEEMLGYKFGEMRGHTISTLYSDINQARMIWNLIDQQDKIVSHEVTLKHRDGTEIPTLLSAVSVRDAEGNIIGQAGFMRDMRQIHLLEERLRALIRAGQSISGLLATEQILQLIMESSIAAFPSAEKGSIHLFDEKTEMLRIEASHGYSAKVDKALTLRIGEGFAGWVYEHGEPIVSANVLEDKRFKDFAFAETRKQKSMICTPLKVKDKVIGVLSLDNLSIFDAFKPNEIDLLSTFASQAANAIENARLFQEVNEGREYLHSLYQASSAIISPRNPNEVLQKIVDAACQATNAWRAVVLLVDENNLPRILVSAGFDHHLDVAINVRETGISRQVIRFGHPRFFPDLDAAKEDVNAAMLAQGTKAAACIPLPLHGKNIGVLWVQFRDKHRFSETEQQTLQLYANQSAVAYDNARRIAELVQLHAATEAIAGAAEPKDVLQQIVKSACDVLDASYTLIWSYDAVRDVFIPEELVAENVPDDWLEKFRQEEPHTGRTTRHVLDVGYVEITDMSLEQANFLGESTRMSLDALDIKSFQSICLDVAGEKLGVLHVDYKKARGFGTEERRLLQNFSNHAALALKKARLLDQVNRARNASAVVAQIVALEKDGQDSWDSIVAGAKKALQCDAVILYRYNEDSGELGYPPAMIGVNYPEKVFTLPKVPDVSIVWKTLQSDDLTIVDNAVSDLLTRNRRFTIDEGIKSMVAIPLKAGNRKVGAMFVNYRNKHRFVDDELINIRLFANQIAVAIRNAQLHDETQKRAATLEGLYKAGKAVTGLLTLNEILERISEQAWHLVGRTASYASISLVEKETVKLVATYPPNELNQSQATFPEIDLKTGINGRFGVTGRASKTGVPQLVDDVSIDKDYLSSRQQTRSELAVPIKLGERVIGVINVESRELHAFGEDNKYALTSLASYAAIAINNAQLHEKTKEQAEILEGLYEAGKVITGTLEVSKALTRISEQSLRVVGAQSQEGCFSHVALLEGNILRFIAGFPLDILDDLRTNVGEIDLEKEPRRGIAGEAVLSEQPQNVGEVEGYPSYIPLREGIHIHSQLSVPLKIGEQIIGVLSIEHPKTAAFSDEDVKNVESLAAQAAVAIENAQLYEAVQRQRNEADALWRVSQALSTTLDPDTVFDLILSELQTVVPYDSASLQVLTDRHLKIISVRGSPNPSRVLGHVWSLTDEIPNTAVISSKQPLIVDTPQTRFGIFKNPQHSRIQCWLGVPLLIGDRVIGMLTIDKKEPHFYKQEHTRLAIAFASQAAIALENANLYDEEQIIANISREAVQSLELNTFLNTLFTILKQVFEKRRIPVHLSLATYDKESSSLIAHHTGFYPEKVRPDTIPLNSQGIMSWAAKSWIAKKEEIYYASNVNEDPHYLPLLLDTHSEIAVTISFADELLAVLDVESPTISAFTSWDKQLLQTLADQIAAMIKNVRQYEELKQTYIKLEQTKGLVSARSTLAWMGLTTNHWRHIIEGHAINIRNTVALLRRSLTKMSDDKKLSRQVEEKLVRIENLASKIEKKPITPPLSSEEGLVRVAVTPLVQERLQQLWENQPYKSIRLITKYQVEDSNMVWISPEWLRRALDILIDNATDELQNISQSRRVITAISRLAKDGIEIAVSDTGRGIPDEVVKQLFVKRVEGPGKSKGLGMGLLIAEAIAETYGGKIYCDSTGTSGTTMVIWLPIKST